MNHGHGPHYHPPPLNRVDGHHCPLLPAPVTTQPTRVPIRSLGVQVNSCVVCIRLRHRFLTSSPIIYVTGILLNVLGNYPVF